jgi:hypothetical protein
MILEWITVYGFHCFAGTSQCFFSITCLVAHERFISRKTGVNDRFVF